MIFLAILMAIILVLLVIGIKFSNIAVKPDVIAYEDTFIIEQNCGKIIKKEFDELYKEEVYIKSPYGYDLHGIYFPIEGSKKTMIFAHGIRFSLFGSVKYMDIFIKRGFNVLIYDHRHHGKSGGNNCSFGFYEKYDLKACTDWVFNRNGEHSIVGIHGESLGAATILQNAAIDNRVSFYIADCPYSDMMAELKFRLREDYHLPSFPFLHLASFTAKILHGFFYNQVSPIKGMANISTPIFFIHGKDDTYIPKEMSIAMYNAKIGKKKIYLAPNSNHAEAYWKNKEEYDRQVGEFLKDINVI